MSPPTQVPTSRAASLVVVKDRVARDMFYDGRWSNNIIWPQKHQKYDFVYKYPTTAGGQTISIAVLTKKTLPKKFKPLDPF